MELTAEQKLALEVDVKAALSSLLKAAVKVADFAALNSANKVDDLVVPALGPMVEAALLDLVAKLKL